LIITYNFWLKLKRKLSKEALLNMLDFSSLHCGVLDPLLFTSPDDTKGVRWGSNDVASYSPRANSNIVFKERNYDKDATPLLIEMEKKNWKQAMKILKDKSTNIEQSNTWTSRYDKLTSKLLWRRTTLESAIIYGAPAEIIKALISLSPHSSSSRNSEGQLPLHLAFECNANDEIISLILLSYPIAATVKDKKGNTPLQSGCAKHPDSYRFKVLNTHSAICKNSRRKQTSEANNPKLMKAKILYDQQIDHITQEHEEKIQECSEKINSQLQKIVELQERLQAADQELTQERNNVKKWKTSYKDCQEEYSILEQKVGQIQSDLVRSKCEVEEKTGLLAQQDKEKSEVKDQLNKCEKELKKYKESYFGGAFKALCYCGDI